MKRLLGVTIFLVLFSFSCAAQKGHVPLTQNYSRVWAIDTVTIDPNTHIARPTHADQMIAYVCNYSSDNKRALCEFVAKDPSKHQALKNAVTASTAVVPGAISAVATAPLLFYDKASTKPEVFEAAAKAAGFSEVDLKKMSVTVR